MLGHRLLWRQSKEAAVRAAKAQSPPVRTSWYLVVLTLQYAFLLPPPYPPGARQFVLSGQLQSS